MNLSRWLARVFGRKRNYAPGDWARMSGKDAWCSFCRKSYRVVGPLVEGPGDVFVCGECIELCQSILDQESRRVTDTKQKIEPRKTGVCCSFCRKSSSNVGPLVEGPGGVFACGNCLKLCESILERELRRRSVIRGGVAVAPLRTLAHGRSGDKGNHANIGVACYDRAAYAHLDRVLTAEVVAEYFRDLKPSRVVRYELPNLLAFNFVLDDVLDGGASRSLRLDSQGKTLALKLLEMEVPALPRL